MIVNIRLVIALCISLKYAESYPTFNDSTMDCNLSDNTNGTCLLLDDCPAAITAKNVSECYSDGPNTTNKCCERDLWTDLVKRNLTKGCGQPVFYIVNGLLTKYKEFPYMAALGWESTFFTEPYDYKCGGVLISYKYVLTAAHCAELNGLPPLVVLLGGTNVTDSCNKPLKVVDIHIHPKYRRNESYHDIALLKLENYANESPICLWSIYPMDSMNLTAIGYGHTQFAGPSSEQLLKTHLSVVPNQECMPHFAMEDSLPNGIVDTQLCAKDFERNSDTCQGDSGGPLILYSISPYGITTPFVVGITSFGQGCAMDIPGVYTRVSEYMDWIEDVVYNNTNKLH